MNDFPECTDSTDLFQPLGPEADFISPPPSFTYPFHYEPHPLALKASEDLQNRFLKTLESKHRFWASDTAGIGKMFGVLVVRHQDGRLGYLASFSGKLESGNAIYPFVPPVYDMLDASGFFRREEAIITSINQKIAVLESSGEMQKWKKALDAALQEADDEIASEKARIAFNRKQRQNQRDAMKADPEPGNQAKELSQLDEESKQEQLALKKRKRYWREKTEALKAELLATEQEIIELKKNRKQLSADLQKRLFDQYTFLNTMGERKSLLEIFGCDEGQVPPSGAGECAAPKLLHYAFARGWTPVCMAEFWWGESPKSEIRRHGSFYPACRSKCLPILGHMLTGMEVDPNPLHTLTIAAEDIGLLYEDAHMLAVNKPAGLLSVPGKTDLESVYTLMQTRYPEEPLLMVHRLDMATSGVLLIARNMEAYHALQRQFSGRSVQKRYVALLDGFPEGEEGEINLPLRVDLDDRPRQLVCYEHGLEAKTIWKRAGNHTKGSRVYFFPVTGRTHQLRVHAAHPSGLHCPIVGDDLYGKKEDRLYLHAESIKFEHPVLGKPMKIVAPAPF
jgi:tRNA pseudouridine32 synthase / 23S rRNA pseudouridine746 synthase